MIKTDWLIVGGGFQGIVSAYLLKKHHSQNVTLLEKSSNLGGVLNSRKAEGLYFDLGCHLFSNSDEEITEFFFDILGNDFHPVDVNYASVVEGHITDGIAVPDFTNLPEQIKQTALFEIIECAAKDKFVPPAQNVSVLLQQRYGKTIADYLIKAIQKITTHTPETLDLGTINKLPLSRIRLLADEEAAILKQIKELDDRLAVPFAGNMALYPNTQKSFPHKNFYPAKKGLRGFCEKAETYLRNENVNIKTGQSVQKIDITQKNIMVTLENGEEIETERMIWSIDPTILSNLILNENYFEGQNKNVPLVLYYFLVPHETSVKYTYLHDYTPENLVYRLSSPGFYGKQVNEEGMSYICAEVPTPTDSEIWNNPESYEEQVWNYVQNIGMLDTAKPVKTIIMKTPVSYPVNSVEFGEKFEDFKTIIENKRSSIIISDPRLYSKVDLATYMKQEIDKIAA